jgi:hypothetical protein
MSMNEVQADRLGVDLTPVAPEEYTKFFKKQLQIGPLALRYGNPHPNKRVELRSLEEISAALPGRGSSRM